jgi:serine protease AprX
MLSVGESPQREVLDTAPPRPEGSRSRLPPEFYRGTVRARRTAILAALLILGSFAGLAAAGLVDPAVFLGPHVARSDWAFAMSGARDLNARGLTGMGVTVCLVDSGIDALHPDFAHLRFVAWKDFVNLRTDPYDDNGHGTAMAGLIVASGSLHGVAPDVSLIVAKVINSAGFGSSAAVADGIRFCVDPFGDGTRGADIISVSLGSKAPLFVATDVSLAAQWAVGRGVFVVASAGNDGGPFDDGDVEAPASVSLAIAVGAVDASGRIAPFSSIGSSVNRTDPNLKPELTAPGVQLISTAPGAHYVTTTGTSGATALAAGIVALLLQAHPELRPGASSGSANVLVLKWALARSATGRPGQAIPHDPYYGYGVIDGLRALSYL